MICEDEIRLLHYLARAYYTGAGALVDLGPLAGGSTYALASGLGDRSDGRIFSYDLWDFHRDWERFFAGKNLQPGDDIMPLFLENVTPFRGRITAVKGDIAAQRWTGGPIEILFVDAAKTPEVMRHIANEFFPHLIRGAIVVHQDYVSAEDPWIHVAMGELGAHFEVTDSPEGGSVCFRLMEPVPPNALSSRYFDSQNARRHLQRARSLLHDWHGLCVWLAEANYAAMHGDQSAAREILEAVLRHPRYEPQVEYDVELVRSRLRSSG